MSVSKCPKCGKSIFQVESITPLGTDRDVLCVICHSCYSTIGILDHLSTGEEIKENNLQIQVLSKKLDLINQNIGQLMNGVKLLYKKIEDSRKISVSK